MNVNSGKLYRSIAAIALISMVIGVLGTILVVNTAGYKIVRSKNYSRLKSADKEFGKLVKMNQDIKDNYVFEQDKKKTEDVMARAMVDSLGDIYSGYMTKDEAEQRKRAINSDYTGIGIVFDIVDGGAKVTAVAESGPAELSGLRVGDIITHVNGKKPSSRNGFLSAISGEPGDRIDLTYLRNGVQETVKVTIAKVTNETAKAAKMGRETGYIRVTSIGEKTGEEFSKAVGELEKKGVKRLLVDLRGNGGGYFDQGISVADQLIPEGTITYTEDRSGKKEYFNSDESMTAMKYAVLVDERTASAAEIIAGAVKVSKSGIVVGEKTYGKGVAQKEFTYPDGSVMHLSSYKYFMPDGGNIDGTGIEPDVKASSGAGYPKETPTVKDPVILKAWKALK